VKRREKEIQIAERKKK